MSANSTEQLAALIDRKHACLVQLRELGGQQMRLVEGGDMGELLGVLAAKQQLIQRLQQIEGELEPYRAEDPERRCWASAEARARCANQAEACAALLDEILTQEKQSESRLTVRRDEVARRLQGAHSATQARSAYTQQSGPASGLLDLSSEA